jgi:hypothetical protein
MRKFSAFNSKGMEQMTFSTNILVSLPTFLCVLFYKNISHVLNKFLVSRPKSLTLPHIFFINRFYRYDFFSFFFAVFFFFSSTRIGENRHVTHKFHFLNSHNQLPLTFCLMIGISFNQLPVLTPPNFLARPD